MWSQHIESTANRSDQCDLLCFSTTFCWPRCISCSCLEYSQLCSQALLLAEKSFTRQGTLPTIITLTRTSRDHMWSTSTSAITKLLMTLSKNWMKRWSDWFLCYRTKSICLGIKVSRALSLCVKFLVSSRVRRNGIVKSIIFMSAHNYWRGFFTAIIAGPASSCKEIHEQRRWATLTSSKH